MPPSCSMRTLDSSLSTQITRWPISAKQAAATSPTYPEPTTAIETGSVFDSFMQTVSPIRNSTTLPRNSSLCLRQRVLILLLFRELVAIAPDQGDELGSRQIPRDEAP